MSFLKDRAGHAQSRARRSGNNHWLRFGCVCNARFRGSFRPELLTTGCCTFCQSTFCCFLCSWIRFVFLELAAKLRSLALAQNAPNRGICKWCAANINDTAALAVLVDARFAREDAGHNVSVSK